MPCHNGNDLTESEWTKVIVVFVVVAALTAMTVVGLIVLALRFWA